MESFKEYHREWRKRNPDKVRMYNDRARYKKKMLAQGEPWVEHALALERLYPEEYWGRFVALMRWTDALEKLGFDESVNVKLYEFLLALKAEGLKEEATNGETSTNAPID